MHKQFSLFLLLFIVMGCLTKGNAQHFYIIDTLDAQAATFTTSDRRIIDLNTCLPTPDPEGYPNPFGTPIYPIDLTNTGQTGIGVPLSLMIETDLHNTIYDDAVVYNFLAIAGAPGIGVPFTSETAAKAIAIDYDDEAYFIGDYLSHVDYIDDNVTSLAILPPNQRPKGQMTFREGSFYYPSVNDELMQLKVSGANYWVRSLGSLPDTLNYGGIFSVPHTCDSTSTYVIHHDTNRGATVYLLDIPSVTLTQHCTMPYKPSAAAYDGENTLPPCDFSFDLNTLVDTTVNRYDTICYGTISLLDENMELLPDLEFDSLVIEITNPLDGIDEWIAIIGSDPEVTLSGNNTHRITLASTGFTKGSSFMTLLEELSYTNDATIPTQGERIINVQVFHQFYDSLQATIYVNIPDDVFEVTEEANGPTCFGLSDGSINLSISGGTEPVDFEWIDDNSLDFARDNLGSGVYVWELMDAVGCSERDSITLVEPDTLTVSLMTEQNSICGSNGTLISQPLGGTTPYSYNWSNSDTDSIAINLTAGTYDLQLTDANDCQAMASYTLIPVDTIFGSAIIESCLGQPISLNGETYEQDSLFQSLFTTADGCDSLVDYQLIFHDTFYTSTSYTLCAGESIDINGISYDRDTTLLFNTPTAFGCDSIMYYDVLVLPENRELLFADICEGELFDFEGELLGASGVYFDTLMAFNGCDSILQLELTVHTLPTPVIQTNGSLCAGGNVVLTSDPYDDYMWSTGEDTNETLVQTPGDYSLSVSDENGCEGETFVSIVDSALVVAYHVEQPACPEDGGRLIFDGFSGGQSPYVVLETGEIIEVNSIINSLTEGIHVFTIQDTNGCQDEITINISSGLDLAVLLPEPVTINLGESIVLEAIPTFTPTSISWSPVTDLTCSDCLTPVAFPKETTKYTLTLESGDGCVWEGTLLVTVKRTGLYIPNAFSPNGDGSNDEFLISTSASVQKVNSIQIFNRWGGLVFESNDHLIQWDGMVDGQQAAPGVYLYQIEWTDWSDRVVIDKGDLMLLR